MILYDPPELSGLDEYLERSRFHGETFIDYIEEMRSLEEMMQDVGCYDDWFPDL